VSRSKTAPPATVEASRSTSSSPTTTKKQQHPYESFLVPSSYDFDDNDEDQDNNDDWQDSVSSFQELQKSTGSEILQAELQQQIDQGADGFLSSLNELEKLAVSSITEQLPQAAVKALSKSKNKKYNDLNFSKQRVTAEQERELARFIQTGVGLYKIKSEAEAARQQATPLTRQEWATAANLTPKQLRQAIVQYRRAKHNLVTANLGLVHTVVNQQYYNKRQLTAGVSKEELVQEGSLGLLRAAELFDPERGLRFSTYAVVWIKGVLQNSHVPELVRVPAREKTKWNKIGKAVQELNRVNGGSAPPSVEELAAVTGLTVAEVVETQRLRSQAGSVLSLDQAHQLHSRSGTESVSVGSDLVDKGNNRHLQEDDDAELAERTGLQADLIAAMARNLDAREARLMRLRYGLSDGVSRSLQECADSMGLSYSRVHQLSKQCLKKLRQAAEAESLEEYLLTIA